MQKDDEATVRRDGCGSGQVVDRAGMARHLSEEAAIRELGRRSLGREGAGK